MALSMFGLTTPAVSEAREVLEGLGYETLVFHATGSGGRALEKLAHDGLLAGVLDLTTTELADELVGGMLTAGPDRLTAAGAAGIPQVVSLGALDMVNFGPRQDVPGKFDGRTFVVHNPVVTLMRTTPEENGELGRRIAAKLAGARGPTVVVLPLRGISGLDIEGGPFWDRAADAELFDALRRAFAASPGGVDAEETDAEGQGAEGQGTDGPGTAAGDANAAGTHADDAGADITGAGATASAHARVRLVERDEHINDPGFGEWAARLLHRMIEESKAGQA